MTERLLKTFGRTLQKPGTPQHVGNLIFLGKFQPPYRNVPLDSFKRARAIHLTRKCGCSPEWIRLAMNMTPDVLAQATLIYGWTGSLSALAFMQKLQESKRYKDKEGRTL